MGKLHSEPYVTDMTRHQKVKSWGNIIIGGLTGGGGRTQMDKMTVHSKSLD